LGFEKLTKEVGLRLYCTNDKVGLKSLLSKKAGPPLAAVSNCKAYLHSDGVKIL
jgi:hypothetical protein